MGSRQKPYPRSTAGVSVVKTVKGLRQKLRLRTGTTIGFVPTMGALHAGHTSLVKWARSECDVVVVSIFINPLQFGPDEDFGRYPRQPARDTRVAAEAGADIIFSPSVEEMYPGLILTKVIVDCIDQTLCGKYRPGHFSGVATVVVKLLNIVQPQRAYFGAKDWQQLTIIKKLVADLNLDVKLVAVPTHRDPDGLATSSRNRYLTPEERRAALTLPAALSKAKSLILQGERRVEKIVAIAKEEFAGEPGVKLEYLSICRPDDLVEVDEIDDEVLVAGAVYVGATRLIDNLVVKP